jgi:hypothetical protein
MELSSEDQVRMFGETIEQMLAAKPASADNLLYAIMLLSNAQDVLHKIADEDVAYEKIQRCVETVRQGMNKAKYFIDPDRTKT